MSKSVINQRFISAFEAISESSPAMKKGDFAKKLHITPQVLTELLGGRMNVSPDILQKLFDVFSVRYEYIFKGEGDILVNTPPVIDTLQQYVAGKKQKAGGETGLFVSPTVSATVSPTSKKGQNQLIETEHAVTAVGLVKPNVIELNSAAAAGSAIFLETLDKVKDAPTGYFPDLGPGIHIRVRAKGDSMHSTIKDGDDVIGTQLSEIRNLRQGHIYIVIDKDDAMVMKRVYFDGGKTVELISDNEMYRPYTRPIKDILMLFRVELVITQDLRPYWMELRRDIREIRAEIADLKRARTIN